MKQVLESEYNRKNAARFKQERSRARDKVLGWYLRLLTNCLAHRELAPQNLGGAEVTVPDSAEGGVGTIQRRVLMKSQATKTAEDIELIDLCPLAPSPLGIVEVLSEAWKTYSLDAYSTCPESPSTSGTLSEAFSFPGTRFDAPSPSGTLSESSSPPGTHSEASSTSGPFTTSSAASRELSLGTQVRSLRRRQPYSTFGGNVDRLHGKMGDAGSSFRGLMGSAVSFFKGSTMGRAGSSFRGRQKHTQNLNGSHLSREIPRHTCLHQPCPPRISLLRAPQLKPGVWKTFFPLRALPVWGRYFARLRPV